MMGALFYLKLQCNIQCIFVVYIEFEENLNFFLYLITTKYSQY